MAVAGAVIRVVAAMRVLDGLVRLRLAPRAGLPESRMIWLRRPSLGSKAGSRREPALGLAGYVEASMLAMEVEEDVVHTTAAS